uniref:Follistatin like 3 n=1 Tax=Junco hyemalis TaxID=40217 RepID=A0A8C5IP83_JUNHY
VAMGALSSHARDPWGCLLWDRPCGSWQHRDPSPSALSTGGICWLQQGKEAKCTMILKTGVTWEECCANGNVDVAWSNYTYPGNKISLLGFLGLVTCHPCKGDELGGSETGPGIVCREQWHSHQPDSSRSPAPSAGPLEMDFFHCTRKRNGERAVRRPWGDLEVMPKAVERAWPPLGSLQLCLPAESCSSVVCPGTHTCVVDQTGSAHCVMCRTAPCPEPTSLDHALCGNNNVTYPSACHLRRATCHRGRSIGVRHYGSCSGEQETDSVEENYV